MCMRGAVGGTWVAEGSLMELALKAKSPVTDAGSVEDFMAMPFEGLVHDVLSGRMNLPSAKVFPLDNIV